MRDTLGIPYRPEKLDLGKKWLVTAPLERPIRLYRAVDRLPPSGADFLHHPLESTAGFRGPQAQRYAVSFFDSIPNLKASAAWREGKHMVTLDLTPNSKIHVARTGKRGHVSVWAPCDILVACLTVQ